MVHQCGGMVIMRKKRTIHQLFVIVTALLFIFMLPIQPLALNDDNYYTWTDDFENAQYIDEQYSDHYIVKDGLVEMYGTYPQWTNPDWTRMKEINIDSNTQMNDCIIKLTIPYDSDMQSDYRDLRFKFNHDDYWLNYWIEEINPEPNNPYVIVWIRIASLPTGDSIIYLFYGNPTASDLSDYWSVFDENSWKNYYTHDNQVTYHMESEGAWDPDVTWGDNMFFVSWEEGIPRYLPLGMLFKQQIRGCFYTEEGEQLGDRFDITPWTSGSTNTFRCENPCAAYGETGGERTFIVCYEEYLNPNDEVSRDIKGAIVPSDTDSITDVTLFDICTHSGNQADPVIAYDADNVRFFVIWEDGREGTENYNLYGRLFDIYGNSVGGEKLISNRPNSQCEPWITFDNVNNHYMIVWEEGVDPELGPFDIWGQLFTVNGDPLGDAQRLSPEGIPGKDYNFPCVAFCDLTERYLITWQEDDLSNNDWYGHIWGKILDENGNIVIDTFKIAHGAYERTNVVPHLSSSFFVVYDGGGDVWGKLVSSEGDVNSYVLQLSDGESDPADWANIDSSGERIFVTWEDSRIVYIDPYEGLNLPDVFANVWSFNTPSGSDISYLFGDEHSLILEATVTSDPINPVNLQSWYRFFEEKTGSISFDIIDGNDPSKTLIADVSSGSSLSSIMTHSIRLKARFTRENPSSSPTLNSWSVEYIGIDEHDPVTRVQDVEGVTGLNEWYISESVTLWLMAEDYPEDTGSGIATTYYTLNDGPVQEYNTDSGLQLITTKNTQWKGEWDVNFWSTDNAGNMENRNKPENTRIIKIDADRPYIEITSPANEEEVEIPFLVEASPTDNVGIDRVEFDIEPFGERPELPYVDRQAPYEWYCDVEQIRDIIGYSPMTNPLGVNVMIRAQVYDDSGQSWINEVWVHVKNWKKSQIVEANDCIIFGFDKQHTVDKDTFIECFIEPKQQGLLNLYRGSFQWNTNNGFSTIIDSSGSLHYMNGVQTGFATSFTGCFFFNRMVFFGYASQVTIQNS